MPDLGLDPALYLSNCLPLRFCGDTPHKVVSNIIAISMGICSDFLFNRYLKDK